MSELTEALGTLGEINRHHAERFNRLEDDLYGPSGLRVQITKIDTTLNALGPKIELLAGAVQSLRLEEAKTAERRGIARWAGGIVAGMVSGTAVSYIVSWMRHK